LKRKKSVFSNCRQVSDFLKTYNVKGQSVNCVFKKTRFEIAHLKTQTDPLCHISEAITPLAIPSDLDPPRYIHTSNAVCTLTGCTVYTQYLLIWSHTCDVGLMLSKCIGCTSSWCTSSWCTNSITLYTHEKWYLTAPWHNYWLSFIKKKKPHNHVNGLRYGFVVFLNK